MINSIKYVVILLSVVVLCASFMIATETNAQSNEYGANAPAYGSTPCTTVPASAPGELPVTTAPTGSPMTPGPENRSVSVPSQASGYATVSGTVTYNNGTLVPGAIVQLQSKYGAQYSTTSGADGHYEISNVKYDSYTFRYIKDKYESPSSTLDVNSASLKRDISLPSLLEGTSAAAPAAVDHSAIMNWYATRYTPQMPSNKAVIYDQSGHIVKVITGMPCQLS